MNTHQTAEILLSALNIPSERWMKPVLVSTFGVPGAGKTEVARYLARRHPLVLLTTDALRQRYGFATGLDTLDTMFQIAETLLPRGTGIIFDGIHMGRRNRHEVRALARTSDADLRFIFVTAKEDIILRRLEDRRNRPEQTASEGKYVISAEHFAFLAGFLDPPAKEEADIVTVDTSDGQLSAQLAATEQWLDRCNAPS